VICQKEHERVSERERIFFDKISLKEYELSFNDQHEHEVRLEKIFSKISKKILNCSFYLQFLVISVIHCAVRATILQCEISCDTEYQIIGTICRCKVQNFNSTERVAITGVHTINNFHNISDIKLLLIDEQIMKFLPSNLHNFFPNLSALIIDSTQLTSIARIDLENFEHLQLLFIGNNKIDELNGDLFHGNPHVEWITYINNFTKRISADIFDALPNVHFVSFLRNSCVNYKAANVAEIENLKAIISRQCG
jgi:Leucine rich repeat